MTLVKIEEPRRQRDARAALAPAVPVPLYEQVKRQLSEQILMGTYQPGTLLPTEVELARTFAVAIGTVRRAMGELAAEGLVLRRRKVGTVVTGRSPHHGLRSFFQYFRLHGRDGALLRSRAEIVHLETAAADAAECRRLGTAAVVRIERVRRVDGRAVMHDRLVIPAARVPDLPGAAELPELLYLFLLSRYGIRIAAVRETIWAAGCEARDRALLDLDGASAVLVIDEIAYDQAGTPTIWGVHRAVTDRYCYLNEIR